MLQNIVMPKLGETMEEGIIVDWLVAEGDAVEKGDPIMVVETDKATLEVESLVEGTLLKIVGQMGQPIPVGRIVGHVGVPGDKMPTKQSVTEQSCHAQPDDSADPPSGNVKQGRKSRGDNRASPRALKLANKLGIDIEAVTGTGSSNRVLSRDVKCYHEKSSNQAPQFAKPKQIEVGLNAHNKLRKITAAKMLLSKQTIPCFELTVEVQVDSLVELRERINNSNDTKAGLHDLLIFAAARALNDYPIMTGQWTEQGTVVPEEFGIGLAVGVSDGVVAPVIRNVKNMTLARVADESSNLIDKAKASKLTPEELSGACLTISSLGMLGIESFTPIVIPGQGSIIGVGKIKEAIMVQNGTFSFGSLMKLTICVDHRLTDGEYAARFLETVKDYLEEPETM